MKLLFALVFGLMPLTLPAQSPEATFWQWFQQHEPALLAVRTGREPICDQLAEAMQRVKPELTFEFGPLERGRREFVISADGIRDAFPAVQRLAAAAPALDHWTVTAFRPGRPGPHVLEVGSVRVSSEKVLVRAEPDGERTGVTLAIPAYRRSDEKAFEQAGYLLLDALLGEYAVETRIGFIEFVDPDRRPTGTWLSLEEFAVSFRR